MNVIIFNPSLSIIEREKSFPVKKDRYYFSDLHVCKNLIYLVYDNNIFIMNTSLEILQEKDIGSRGFILGVDDSSIYTQSIDNKFKIDVIDWNLKYVNTICFQDSDSKKAFYIDSVNLIAKIVKKSSRFFVILNSLLSKNYNFNIYDEKDGILLKTIEFPFILYVFVLSDPIQLKFDSNYLIVFYRGYSQIFYHDLFGNLVKHVHIDNCWASKITGYGIDHNDQLYAYSSKYMSDIMKKDYK